MNKKKFLIAGFLVISISVLTSCVYKEKIQIFTSSDKVYSFSYDADKYNIDSSGTENYLNICSQGDPSACFYAHIYRNLGDEYIHDYIAGTTYDFPELTETKQGSYKIIKFSQKLDSENFQYDRLAIGQNYFINIFYNSNQIETKYSKAIELIIKTLEFNESITNSFSEYSSDKVGIKLRYPDYFNLEADWYLKDPYLYSDEFASFSFEKRNNDREFSNLEYIKDYYNCEPSFVKNFGDYEMHECSDMIQNEAGDLYTTQDLYFYIKDKDFIIVNTKRVLKDYFVYLDQDFENIIKSIELI